jgi:N-formylglutamate amidohydrolase
MIQDPFYIIEPKGKKVPIVVSVPHSGTLFPNELKDLFKEDKMSQPDDTDWFVHQLYNFVSELGITIIHAKYSRWVIDLNRDPESKPLYTDGRIITGLTTTTDFFGNPIYKDEQYQPTDLDLKNRVENYYLPYHNKINALLTELKQTHDRVLLWDAHSIRRFVPTINASSFPDLILGNNDLTSADGDLIDTTLKGLSSAQFEVTHNTPFKGGYITRSFGKPMSGISALQLEMSKNCYMEDDELTFSEKRSGEMRKLLQPIFLKLIEKLT